MVFSVRDVKTLAVQRQTLWPMESSLVKGAVFRADLAAADGLDERAVEFSNDYAVVIRVGNEQTIVTCIRDDFAGKRERQFADFRAFEHEFQRFFIQFTLRAKFG